MSLIKVDIQLIEFKKQKNDKSRYEGGSFVTFKKIEIPSDSLIFDYNTLKSIPFIKIQRKKAIFA